MAIEVEDLDVALLRSVIQRTYADVSTQPRQEFIFQAAVHATEGALAAARGDHNTARCSFEDAIDLLSACDAPYDAGRVRLELAATLAAQGREDQARRELEAAIAAFREMGAAAERARAAAMLERCRDTDSAIDGPLARLSARELQVLGLVAEGLTNHDIARRLVLSEHTVNSTSRTSCASSGSTRGPRRRRSPAATASDSRT